MNGMQKATIERLHCPNAVDGVHANVTYNNGVVVVTLPLSEKAAIADITVPKIVGHTGH